MVYQYTPRTLLILRKKKAFIRNLATLSIQYILSHAGLDHSTILDEEKTAKFKKINNNNGLFIPHNPGQRIRAGCNYRI